MTTETTAALLDRLERHYIKPGNPMPGGIFVPEVGQNGGWGTGSRCDAIYVGFTSTSGRLLVGHELKVSRADWLNELKHPGKSDAWADQCHEWWLVVPDPSIVHDGELPAGWGLMSPPRRSATRMQVHTKAARKPDGHLPSWDSVRSIMARQDTLRAAAIEAGVAKAREAMWAEQEKRVAGKDETWRHRCGQLESRLESLQEALGGWGSVTFDENGRARSATPDQLADLVKLLRVHGDLRQAQSMLTGGYVDPLHSIETALGLLRAAIAPLAGGDA